MQLFTNDLESLVNIFMMQADFPSCFPSQPSLALNSKLLQVKSSEGGVAYVGAPLHKDNQGQKIGALFSCRCVFFFFCGSAKIGKL